MKFIPAFSALMLLSATCAYAGGGNLVDAHKALCDKAGHNAKDINLINPWQGQLKAEAKALGEAVIHALNTKFGAFLDASKHSSFELEVAVLDCNSGHSHGPLTIDLSQINWDAQKHTGALTVHLKQDSSDIVAQLRILKADALTPAGAKLLADHKGQKITR